MKKKKKIAQGGNVGRENQLDRETDTHRDKDRYVGCGGKKGEK